MINLMDLVTKSDKYSPRVKNINTNNVYTISGYKITKYRKYVKLNKYPSTWFTSNDIIQLEDFLRDYEFIEPEIKNKIRVYNNEMVLNRNIISSGDTMIEVDRDSIVFTFNTKDINYSSSRVNKYILVEGWLYSEEIGTIVKYWTTEKELFKALIDNKINKEFGDTYVVFKDVKIKVLNNSHYQYIRLLP